MKLRAQIVHQDWPGIADIDVLRRRRYMRVVRLPRRWVALISWLDLG